MTDHYRADFSGFMESEVLRAPVRFHALRNRAFKQFEALGFPTQKDEDWHFTNVAAIADAKFPVWQGGLSRVPRRQLEPFFFYGDADWPTFVFVNGDLDTELSRTAPLPDGVRVSDLRVEWNEDQRFVQRHLATIADVNTAAFTALNTAFMTGGAVIHIGREAVADVPIHLVFLTTADAERHAIHPRVLIIAERNSRASVVESYGSIGTGEYFTNVVTEVHLAADAQVDHYRIQRESPRAFHVGTVQAHQARGSRFRSFSFATGGALSRVNVHTVLDGEGGEAVLDGLYMTDGTQHMDHQTRIVHAKPNCGSREVYKGILDDASHGVFNGKVYVHPAAQKTDGKQTNNNLLLSDKARVDTKPQLEIFADDVKCTHGATVGRLDDTALFYMKSRGISASAARELLTYAFAADVLERIELESLRTALESLTLTRFTRAAASV